MTVIAIPPEEAHQRVDQFILFGDSITQFSYNQQLGFGLSGALQDGEYPFFSSCFLFLCGGEYQMLSLDSVYSKVRCH